MHIGLTPGFLFKGINLHPLYRSVSSGFSSSVANFLAIFSIIFEISIVARSLLEFVSVHLHQGQMVFEIHTLSWLHS